jgi:protein tyrosine/serine phosphatase
MADVSVQFENLPNFRQAGMTPDLTNREGKKIKNGLLYRSSRTDFITENDKKIFRQLGIKSVIDLRRKSEYERSDGMKLLDSMYPMYVLEKGEIKPMRPSMRWGGSTNGGQSVDEEHQMGRRYLVNMWTMELIWHVFMQVNFIIRWSSLILVAIDWLIGSHLFVKFFNWMLFEQQTVSQQYIDVLENTKPVVADLLRLMCQEDSLPALVHCAHGKDRTGIVVAVVMGLLGVDDDIIIKDYAESENGLACIKDRIFEEIVVRYGFRVECTYAREDTMKEVLKHVDEKYGSMSEYLLSAGFTLKEQEKFKSIFLLD